MRETEVILKGILLSLYKCETIEEACEIVENLMTADEVAGVRERFEKWKKRQQS